MKLQDGIELLARVLMEVLIAERKTGPGTGGEKKKYVMGRISPALSEARSPSFLSPGNIDEILEVISELVNIVVKLLSLLGIFKHARAAAAKKNPPEDE